MGRDPPAPNIMSDMIYQVVGYGGTAPSPSLELLGPPSSTAVPATAMASSHRDPRFARVPYGAVAPGDPCVSSGGGVPYLCRGSL